MAKKVKVEVEVDKDEIKTEENGGETAEGGGVEQAETVVIDSDGFKDKYVRLLAEFDNYRKRTERERLSAYGNGTESVVAALLPVIDNFERAVSSEKEDSPFKKGVEMIYKQLSDALERFGLTAIDAAGREFNPDLHDAVMHVEDESLGANVVAEELRKGYRMGERVLRHSMVKVAN